MVPFDEVVRIFETRPGGLRSPATEVLINFNAGAIRRIAGYLTSTRVIAGREKTLAHMDEVCGGPWWRQEWLAYDDKDAAEEAIVFGYASGLANIPVVGVGPPTCAIARI